MAHCVTARELERIARAAIASCAGDRLVAEALREFPEQPWIVGAGKAVGAMAKGARDALGGRFRQGPLIGKHEGPEGIAVTLAGHPIPDQRGVAATHSLLRFLGERDEHDVVVLLLSGGASALLAATVPGVSLEALARATAHLIRAGAPIESINCLRRHLGLALGGRLALATRARIHALVLSDVVGDDPAAIGSGPVSPDPTTLADALAVVRRWDVDGSVRDLLERGAIDESPKPADPGLARVTFQLLATPIDLRDHAAAEVRNAGFQARVVKSLIVDNVNDVANHYVKLASSLAPGEVAIAVGEPTVIVRGDGRGGRAQHLALLVARAIAGRPVAFLAIGSDGSDGPTDAAGASVDGATIARAGTLGLDVDEALARSNASPLLDAVGALLRTGSTGTNLLDLHLVAALDASAAPR